MTKNSDSMGSQTKKCILSSAADLQREHTMASVFTVWYFSLLRLRLVSINVMNTIGRSLSENLDERTFLPETLFQRDIPKTVLKKGSDLRHPCNFLSRLDL